jgi:hypothetical protein
MKTVLIVIGCLFLAFLLLFIFCACRVASWCDREEEAMFEHWYANHTEEPEKEAADA